MILINARRMRGAAKRTIETSGQKVRRLSILLGIGAYRMHRI